MSKEITIKLTKEELRLLTGLMMNAKFGMLKGIDESWRPIINSLAEKLSLEDIRQSVKN